MSSSDSAISLRAVSKAYRLFDHPADRVKQYLLFGLKRYYRPYMAVRDVSMQIARGETIGILGPNGSGKSTILQLICGILKPTAGDVRVNGRVSALLELGSGFNPQFSGRENVYFQGTLMGLSRRRIDERFDDIAAFAELGEFIDQQVFTYSSGMFVRLAFAVAVHFDPEILVVDEALAVGDVRFQRRCFDRIYELQRQGVTIIVVSHNPYQLERLCHRICIADQGVFSPLLDPRVGINRYHTLLQQAGSSPMSAVNATRTGTGELRFANVRIENDRGEPGVDVASGAPLRILAEVETDRPIHDVRFRFEICSGANEVATMITTIGLTESMTFSGRHRIAFAMAVCPLTSGWYYVNAIAVDRNVRLDTWHRAVEFVVRLDEGPARDLSSDNGVFVCEGNWQFD